MNLWVDDVVTVKLIIATVTRWRQNAAYYSGISETRHKHTEGMVASIIWILLEIYFSFQQRKNCENPLRIDKVIAMSLVYYFSGTQYSMPDYVSK